MPCTAVGPAIIPAKLAYLPAIEPLPGAAAVQVLLAFVIEPTVTLLISVSKEDEAVTRE